MGAYLSEPKISKESSDLQDDVVKCGASSMQGWRMSQEDAHNCILDFDKNASLFAVYDGHGGHEVAEYCSKNLPDFIKKTDSYIKGDFEQALKDAFLGFDATLATTEVIKELKLIAGRKGDDNTNSHPDNHLESEEEGFIDNLVEEAHMPLNEVMAKYKLGGVLGRVISGEGKPPVSPMLRGRKSANKGGPSSSGAGSSSSSTTDFWPSSTVTGDAEVTSSSSKQGDISLCNGEVHFNGEIEDEEERENETETEVKVESSNSKKENLIKPVCNKPIKKCFETGKTEADSSGLTNGEFHYISSSDKKKDIAEENGITSSSPPKRKAAKVSAIEMYQTLFQQSESDSEEEDETFLAEADAESDNESSDEGSEGGGKEDADDSSSVDDGDVEEEDEDEDYPVADVKEEPGSDSGCTAVVALRVGPELYVANAGDSRCVVCRDGQAVEMSFDHKPEDEPERERIENAGGKVTCDGRVNGGLNLSRAIGDHSYKQVQLFPPSKQMITALPDVKQLTINPEHDEFMVIACDGIWNSMTSQDVVDFIRVKLQQKTDRLSQICEEMFDHCLAPNTQGDGTGCDNMTCIIVQFKPKESGYPVSIKRPSEEEIEELSAKKSKIDKEVQTS